MVRSFKLPDLGEGIREGEVLAVMVSVGDAVAEGDTLLEIETDKATVELPSPYTGTVTEIRVKAGDRIEVGEILVVFDGTGKTHAEAPPAREKPSPAPERPPAPEAAQGGGGLSGPVPASPATRRLARELGVDLGLVTPSGPSGQVTAEDVRAFAGQTPTPDAPPPAAAAPSQPQDTAAGPMTALPDFSRWGTVESVPLRSIRRATARRMAQAWSQIPHVTSEDAVDITALESLRQRHKADIEAAGGRLTLTVFALKAVTAALRAHPRFNASLDAQNEQIILKRYYHIGVAVDTPDGLIVPVLRDVDSKSITDLAVELNTVIKLTRERKISIDQLQGGTFTVTNIGSLGATHFSAIINTPEVAIFGMGAARLQPVVVTADDGTPRIEARLMLPIGITIDHRVLDGADAVRFLRQVAGVLADPEKLLLEMN